MSTNRATPNSNYHSVTTKIPLKSSYYALLGLHPSASALEIRRSYRELSKLYHPDTTELPKAIATAKFQELNEAYSTLSNLERRLAYDTKIGYSHIPVIQPLPNLHHPPSPKEYQSSSAYLDPTDRPLSAGEIFALFLLLITFVGCLLIAIAIGLTRPETVLAPVALQNQILKAQVITTQPPTPQKAPVTINNDPLNN